MVLFNSTSAIISIFISFVAIIVHATIGLINTDITRYIPFGIIPSLYIFIYSYFLVRMFCSDDDKKDWLPKITITGNKKAAF